MSDSQQELLHQAWTEGRTGTFSALSQAKALALREVWWSEGKGGNQKDCGLGKGSRVFQGGGGVRRHAGAPHQGHIRVTSGSHKCHIRVMYFVWFSD